MATSCDTCPSRLSPEGAADWFGANFGPDVEVCARHGHVLGKPGLREVAVGLIKTKFAEVCGDHGDPLPDRKPVAPTALVMIPNPRKGPTGQILVPSPGDEAKSCIGCVNFVSALDVRNELGWSSPLCRATGRLLLNDRLTVEPKSCGYGYRGVPEHGTDGLSYMPLYDNAFKEADSVIAVNGHGGKITLNLNVDSIIDPPEYPTDMAVSAEDIACGIRAWREVPDGHGRSVYMPIFDTAFFTEAEQRKIPRTGSDEHPELYVDYDNLVYDLLTEMAVLNETPLLIGDAGVGKTELMRHFAWLGNMPFDRITLGGSTEVETIAGKWMLTSGNTEWMDGRLSASWPRPGVTLVDEISLAHHSVVEFFRPLTDNSKQLVLDEAKGQVVERNEHRYLAFTSNPSWDHRYLGSNEFSDADGNRLAKIWMAMPSEEIEKAIIRRRCAIDDYEIPDALLDTIMKIAADIRALTDGDSATLPISWGLRPQIAVARKTAWYDLEKCYRRALTDMMEPSQARIIITIVSNYN